MRSEVAGAVGLGLYVVGLGVAFGVRTWRHHRATGSTGFRGLSGRAGSPEWWGGVLFALALTLGAAGLLLAATGTVPAPVGTPAWVTTAGLVLAVAGFIGVVLAQSGMGVSWRIGVDPDERTDLVTGGLFAVVRNPIFSGMCLAVAGLALLAPTLLTVAALVCLVLAVETQVRVVEEPYLLTAHGSVYGSYAARVGRFVPGLGRLAQPARR